MGKLEAARLLFEEAVLVSYKRRCGRRPPIHVDLQFFTKHLDLLLMQGHG